jgi:hypothetical protein
VLALAVLLQLVDLRHAHNERRVTSRSEAFHAWPRVLVSNGWREALPHYEQLVLVPASQCGGAPIGHEEPAFLAGLYGLAINSGAGARWDEQKRRANCGRLEGRVSAGLVDDRSLYLLTPARAARLRETAKTPVVCGMLDTAHVCVSARSYQAWHQAAALR